jgi:hypothetical protein
VRCCIPNDVCNEEGLIASQTSLTQACQAVVAAIDITCNVLSHCYNIYACFNCHTPRHHCASFELVLIWTKLMVVAGQCQRTRANASLSTLPHKARCRFLIMAKNSCRDSDCRERCELVVCLPSADRGLEHVTVIRWPLPDKTNVHAVAPRQSSSCTNA